MWEIMEDPYILSYILSYFDHASAMQYLLTNKENYKMLNKNKRIRYRIYNYKQQRLLQKYRDDSTVFFLPNTRNVYVNSKENTTHEYKSLKEIYAKDTCKFFSKNQKIYKVNSTNVQSTHHTHILKGDIIGYFYVKDEKNIKSVELCIDYNVIGRINENKLFPVLRQLYNMEGIPFYILRKKILLPQNSRAEINIEYFKECKSVLYSTIHNIEDFDLRQSLLCSTIHNFVFLNKKCNISKYSRFILECNLGDLVYALLIKSPKNAPKYLCINNIKIDMKFLPHKYLDGFYVYNLGQEPGLPENPKNKFNYLNFTKMDIKIEFDLLYEIDISTISVNAIVGNMYIYAYGMNALHISN